jgi:hypothetical protein
MLRVRNRMPASTKYRFELGLAYSVPGTVYLSPSARDFEIHEISILSPELECPLLAQADLL